MGLQKFISSCLQTIQQQAFAHFYDKTFDVIEADSPELQDIAFKIRYQVYCQENPLLPAENYPDGRERDRFDDQATHFLLYHKNSERYIGTLRLLLPQPETPLTSLEIQRLCDHPLLQIENRVMGLCEISRFCLLGDFRKRNRDGNLLPAYYEQQGGAADLDPEMDSGLIFFRRRIPYAPLGLLKAACKHALKNNIVNCVMMVESGQLPALSRLGMPYRVLGPRLPIYGMQQPLIFSIKATLDQMAHKNPACWEVMSDHGKLQKSADKVYSYDWQDSVFNEECRRQILQRLLS